LRQLRFRLMTYLADLFIWEIGTLNSS